MAVQLRKSRLLLWCSSRTKGLVRSGRTRRAVVSPANTCARLLWWRLARWNNYTSFLTSGAGSLGQPGDSCGAPGSFFYSDGGGCPGLFCGFRVF